MKHAVEPLLTGALHIFEKSCAYCGARFRVLATQGPYESVEAQYECPDCGKGYRIEGADDPEVQLLRPRTDGKNDRYQETMF
jgi:DNA-directed RNA polymerase subunit RPC12/RpoP